jgi:ubiquinone/menaquinone biosynthesis C-methylase UbiE
MKADTAAIASLDVPSSEVQSGTAGRKDRSAMSFYDERILPYVLELYMRKRHLQPYRERVLAMAAGRVLEIGIGSGLNLPHYGASVREIVGLEPAPRLIAMARRVAERQSSPVELIEGSAEAIPLDRQSIDTVVTTWTLCTIPDVSRALGEMRRVLKPGGQLLFVEHGLAPEPNVRTWQNWLNPIWKRIGGGCHLNRPIRQLIKEAGFSIVNIETGYMKGPKPMSFMYEGSARPQLTTWDESCSRAYGGPTICSSRNSRSCKP